MSSRVETSKKGELPDRGLPNTWAIYCNICGDPLVIHYWDDGDVHVDPCERGCKG